MTRGITRRVVAPRAIATAPRARRERGTRSAARTRAEPGDGLREALREARDAPPGVSDRDFANYYRVLNSQTPEEASEAVRAMAAAGELTEGVVEAALATMRAAEEKNEEEQVLQALRGVFNFLLDAYQQLNAPPELEVIDAVVSGLNAMPEGAESAEAEENVLRSCVEAAGMELGAFSASIDGFLVSMEEQDETFSQQVEDLRARGITPEQEGQIEQLMFMRANAKAQMLCIREICARLVAA